MKVMVKITQVILVLYLFIGLIHAIDPPCVASFSENGPVLIVWANSDPPEENMVGTEVYYANSEEGPRQYLDYVPLEDANFYEHEDIDPDETTYYYWLKNLYGDGYLSDFSPGISTLTLTTTSSENSINLYWDNAYNLPTDGYLINRGTSPYDMEPLAYMESRSFIYQDFSVEPWTQYYYRVDAILTDACGDESSQASRVSESLQIQTDLHTLSGWVLAEDDLCPEMTGSVKLHLVTGSGQYPLADSTTFDISGYYQFTDVPTGDYLIKAVPDSTDCPRGLQTYYGDVNYWGDTTPLMVSGGNTYPNIDIAMTVMDIMIGEVEISGFLTYAFDRASGEPVPGADVYLEQEPEGKPISSTTTSKNGKPGKYVFPDVSGGVEDTTEYKIVIDIPGLLLDEEFFFVVGSATTYMPFNNFIVSAENIERDSCSVGGTIQNVEADLVEDSVFCYEILLTNNMVDGMDYSSITVSTDPSLAVISTITPPDGWTVSIAGDGFPTDVITLFAPANEEIPFSSYMNCCLIFNPLEDVPEINLDWYDSNLGDSSCSAAADTDLFTIHLGCMDETASNYDPDATVGCCCISSTDTIFERLVADNSSNYSIEVWLDSGQPVLGFQFNQLVLSDEITMTSAHGGVAGDSGWNVQVGGDDNNLVLGYTMTGLPIPSGLNLLTILNFDGWEPTAFCIADLQLVGPDLLILESSAGDCIELTGTKGDVDGNGEIDITDIVLAVGIILGDYTPNYYRSWASDLNEDNEHSVIDIVQLVCMILDCGVTRSQPISSSSLSITDNSVTVAADGDIAGMQFEYSSDFEITQHFLPPGWEMSQSDHTILMFSTDGTPLIDEVLFEYSGEITINSNIIVDWLGNSITATISSIIPTDYVLLSAYPNPFNPVTAISFELPEAAVVSLRIYDMNGREVSELVNGELSAGYHRLEWDAGYQASGI
ncbi:MAG: hypothetical protein HQ510_03920, partial [Candidatus Marinimicrobia bacterium]|nr:hypothetical protein [Candidatus Neomarinimicrobiota bacterium]